MKPVRVKTQAEFEAAVARGDGVEVRAGYFTAHDGAVVWARDHAQVYARDNAHVYARDHSVVYAHDNAVVRRPLPIDPAWRKMYERELERATCAG